MIKKTLAIINPAYLSLKDGQLVVREIVANSSESKEKIITALSCPDIFLPIVER